MEYRHIKDFLNHTNRSAHVCACVYVYVSELMYVCAWVCVVHMIHTYTYCTHSHSDTLTPISIVITSHLT